jgi:hypothetical protein
MVGTGKSGEVVKSRANGRIVIARICNSRVVVKSRNNGEAVIVNTAR